MNLMLQRGGEKPWGLRPFALTVFCFSSGNLDKQTEWGNTALHYCCMYEKPECLKLLLRGKPATDISESLIGGSSSQPVSSAHMWQAHNCWIPLPANQNGETALDVARRLRNTQCEEAVSISDAGAPSWAAGHHAEDFNKDLSKSTHSAGSRRVVGQISER